MSIHRCQDYFWCPPSWDKPKWTNSAYSWLNPSFGSKNNIASLFARKITWHLKWWTSLAVLMAVHGPDSFMAAPHNMELCDRRFRHSTARKQFHGAGKNGGEPNIRWELMGFFRDVLQNIYGILICGIFMEWLQWTIPNMPKRVVVCLHVCCVSGIGVVVDADSWHPKNGMERGTVEPLLLLGCKTGLDMGHILDFLIPWDPLDFCLLWCLMVNSVFLMVKSWFFGLVPSFRWLSPNFSAG